MKRFGLLVLIFVILATGACGGGGIRSSVKANVPLSTSLSANTMAVYFEPGKPEFQEGLDLFKPMALAELQSAGIVSSVTAVDSLNPPPATDLAMNVRIGEYVKSNAGFWVRGGLADQAKLIVEVVVTDLKSNAVVTSGAVGAWTFDNASNEQVAKECAVNLVRFMRKQYDPPEG
jgi:hypothetical protein